MNKYSRIGKKKVVNLCIKTAYLKAAQNIAAIDVAFAFALLQFRFNFEFVEWKCVDIRMHNYHETFVVVLWDCYGWIRLTLPLVIVQRHKRFVNTFHMAWVISIESIHFVIAVVVAFSFNCSVLFLFFSLGIMAMPRNHQQCLLIFMFYYISLCGFFFSFVPFHFEHRKKCLFLLLKSKNEAKKYIFFRILWI